MSLVVDDCRPKTRNDLIVNQKKIQQLEGWFDLMYGGRRPEKPPLYLILSGPTGCGKTETLNVIANERKVHLLELVFSSHTKAIFLHQMADDESKHRKRRGHIKQIQQMQNFLLNANQSSIDGNFTRRLCFVKDLPTTFYDQSEEYSALLEKYYIKFGSRGVPLVFVMTNSERSTSKASVYRAFPERLRQCVNMHEIEFNPIPITSILKLLTSITRNRLSSVILDRIVNESNGDIRAALNSLQTQFGHEISIRSNTTFLPPALKRRKTSSNNTQEKSVFVKDHPMSIFHYLGKILYCKRHKKINDSITHKLPSHLRRFERLPLKENPFKLADLELMSVNQIHRSLFNDYLRFADGVDAASGCARRLSDASLYITDSSRMDYQSTLDGYGSSISVAGLMFHLNNEDYEVLALRRRVENGPTKFGRDFTLSGMKIPEEEKKQEENRALVECLLRSSENPTSIEKFSLDILPYVLGMKNHEFHKSNESILKRLNSMAKYSQINEPLFPVVEDPRDVIARKRTCILKRMTETDTDDIFVISDDETFGNEIMIIENDVKIMPKKADEIDYATIDFGDAFEDSDLVEEG